MKKKLMFCVLAMAVTLSACGSNDGASGRESVENSVENEENGNENGSGTSEENEGNSEAEENASLFIESSDDIEVLLSEENCKAYFDKEGMITAITYAWSAKDYDEDEEANAYYISGDEVYSWEFGEINTTYRYRMATIEAACMPGVHAFFEVGFKVTTCEEGEEGEFELDILSYNDEVAPYAVIDPDEFCGSYSGDLQYWNKDENSYETEGSIVINITEAGTVGDGDDGSGFGGDVVVTLNDGSVYEMPIESAGISPSDRALSICVDNTDDFGRDCVFDYLYLIYDSDTNQFCWPENYQSWYHWNAVITKD